MIDDKDKQEEQYMHPAEGKRGSGSNQDKQEEQATATTASPAEEGTDNIINPDLAPLTKYDWDTYLESSKPIVEKNFGGVAQEYLSKLQPPKQQPYSQSELKRQRISNAIMAGTDILRGIADFATAGANGDVYARQPLTAEGVQQAEKMEEGNRAADLQYQKDYYNWRKLMADAGVKDDANNKQWLWNLAKTQRDQDIRQDMLDDKHNRQIELAELKAMFKMQSEEQKLHNRKIIEQYKNTLKMDYSRAKDDEIVMYPTIIKDDEGNLSIEDIQVPKRNIKGIEARNQSIIGIFGEALGMQGDILSGFRMPTSQQSKDHKYQTGFDNASPEQLEGVGQYGTGGQTKPQEQTKKKTEKQTEKETLY